jgi:hypothetical protein
LIIKADASNKLTASRKTAKVPFVGILKLDRGYFESKITAYGRFALAREEEKEKKQSFHRLAPLSCIAGSCGFSLPVRCRDQS